MTTLNSTPLNQNKSTNGRAQSIGTELLRGVVGLGSKLAPLPTSGWLVDRFSRTNRRVQRSESLADALLLADRWELDHDGRTIRGYTMNPEGAHPAFEGRGPSVLLVHGWDGGAHQLLPFVRPLVERGYSVSLFDLPGHGASDGDRTNLRDIADAIARVGSHVGPLAGVVAHSVGSAGTAIAILEGLEVGRVAFVAPPLSLETQARAFADSVGATEDAVRPMLATLRGILGRPIDAEAFLDAVQRIDVPLLVVHDRGDRIIPFEGSERIVARWPGSRLLVTEGLGHARLLKHPQTVDAIVRFVDGNVAPIEA